MVQLGIDRIGEFGSLLKGKRIGLITNYSGVNSDLTDDMTAFDEAGYKVIKLFTPEHGLYGAMDGAKVTSSEHPKYHIPIISLYGEKLKPSSEDLAKVDLLIYDILGFHFLLAAAGAFSCSESIIFGLIKENLKICKYCTGCSERTGRLVLAHTYNIHT